MSFKHTPGTLLLLGSGPGIGVSIASHFAQKHFKHIVITSRNRERLNAEKIAIEKAASETGKNVSVETKAVDISDFVALKKVFEEVEKIGPVECVYFNAARVAPGELLKEDVKTIEEDFKLQNLALYQTAAWAIPLLKQFGEANASSSPALLVTNSLLYKDPIPAVFSLSMSKSAQRTLVRCLYEEYGKEVHIGLISVGGEVSPDRPHMSPKLIASKAWDLFAQTREHWELEVEILEK